MIKTCLFEALVSISPDLGHLSRHTLDGWKPLRIKGSRVFCCWSTRESAVGIRGSKRSWVPEKETDKPLIRKLYTQQREVASPKKRFQKPPQSLARPLIKTSPLRMGDVAVFPNAQSSAKKSQGM